MSIRLLRESSETPNITNRDDTHMTRYAYGNISGIIKDFGDELSYSTANSKFSLNSGRAVIQGWEVEIEPGSWVLDLSIVTGRQYYLIYLEINIAVETAEIKSVYLPGAIPSIEPGDDLTKYPQGIARIPLYTFSYSSGVFSDIVKVIKTIPYSGQRLDAIEERLVQLGFKEGVASISNFNIAPSGELVTYDEARTVIKQGKMALLNVVVAGYVPYKNSPITITIPETFRPKEEISLVANVLEKDGFSYINCTLGLDGVISFLVDPVNTGSRDWTAIMIFNIGWQLP